MLFIFTQLNTPIDHHRASPICYHRTDQELHYATTGQVRSAATEQIRDFTMPPLGKTDLLQPNRSTNKLQHATTGQRRSASTEQIDELHCATTRKKIDLLPPIKSQSSDSPPPGRSDLLPPSGSRNLNSPPLGKSNLLPPSRNLHFPPPGKTNLQKIADFSKRKRLALWHSKQPRIRANCRKEKFTKCTEIGMINSHRYAPIQLLFTWCAYQPQIHANGRVCSQKNRASHLF